MKKIIPLLFILPLVTTAFAQTTDFYGKKVAGEICNQYGIKDDKDAKECLDKICDASDIPNNFVLAPCTNIDNCFALYKNGYSYIVYDINFFKKVQTFGFTSKSLPGNNIDWAALTILAHEIGHHMCLHTTNPNLSSVYTPLQIEIQADEYAGSVLYKLGATLVQAQKAMKNEEVPEQGTLTHPGRPARLEAIAKGWNKEFAKNAARNSSGTLPTVLPPVANPPVTDNTNNKSHPVVDKLAASLNPPLTNNSDSTSPLKGQQGQLIGGGALAKAIGRKFRSNKGPEKSTTSQSLSGNDNQIPNQTPGLNITEPGYKNMVLVEGGTFNMGINTAQLAVSDKALHTVNVSSFYISKFLVTVADFNKFIRATGYVTTTEQATGATWLCDADGHKYDSLENNTLPVVHVSWDDAVKYCEWMSSKSGSTYRLPTEAEWEYAARGGKKGGDFLYSGSNNLDDVGWYSGNSGNTAHKVGQKQANELGLYDMTGNILEWCSDWFDGSYYTKSPAQDPKGPATGEFRCARGGSFDFTAPNCRTTSRHHNVPTNHGPRTGFRVVFTN